MKSMGNARPLAHQECSVLAYHNGWVRFDKCEMKFYDNGKYEWIDLNTNQVILNVKEWEYN